MKAADTKKDGPKHRNPFASFGIFFTYFVVVIIDIVNVFFVVESVYCKMIEAEREGMGN